MGVKLGSGDVSFRLGAATPAKVAIGSTEVWTDVVPTVPGIPTGLTVTTDEDNQSSVDVSWTAPESDGDSPITGYKLYRSLDGSTHTLHASPSGTSATVTVAGNGGQTIYLKVAAVNAVGEGSPSEVTTGTLSDSAPGVIDFVQLVVNGPLTLSLQWSPPAIDGGDAITGYIISYTTTSGGSTVYTETVGPEVTDYTFDGTGESVGFEYNATVAATNSIGTGPTSAYVDAALADVPGTPSWMSASSSMTSQGAIAISLTSASENGSPITQYEVEYDTGEYFSTSASVTFPDTSSATELTGLAGGQTYYLRARAANAAGNGEWTVWGSNPVTASATVPEVPADFSVAPDYENEEWDATWTETGDGGGTITAYEIEEADQDFLSSTTETKYGTGSSHSWSVGVADQLRNFRIRAVNSVGASDWTEWTSATYDTPTVPGAPTITSAIYDGSVTTVSYTEPGDNGNSSITDYTFYFNGNVITPDSTGANTATFNYDYTGQDATMTATNGVGEGAASAVVEVTTV